MSNENHTWNLGRKYLLLTLFLSSNIFSFSQKTITGKIITESGAALAGASVVEKGTNNGTVTTDNGGFGLTVSGASAKLVVSFIGYTTTEIEVKEQSDFTISLTLATSGLEDIVVIGYGTSKKRDLTGAVGSVSEKKFNKGIFTSPDQLIQGKVSGLQITNNNGQPGGESTIKIRGNSALSGTGQPLYVIDGVPLDGRSLQPGVNPLNFLNPDNIASIDVLKDASATAIYGSRAAYGVIIINTKKARVGQPVISFGVSTGISTILRKIEVLNASQFREAIAYYNVNPAFDHGGNTDALDAILQQGFQTNYTLGITGGNENGKYRISGNYLEQDGIIKNSGFKKYGLDFTTNFKFLESKKLGLAINLYSSQYIQDGTQSGIFESLRWNPTDSLRNADGTFKKVNGLQNPLAAVELIKNNIKNTTLLGSISPSYKISDWLEYKLLFSINYSSGISRSSENQDISLPQNPPGTATIRNNELTTSLLTHTLQFNKEILPQLKLDAIAGYEFTQFKNKGFSLRGNGVPGTGFGNFGIDYTNYIQYSDLNGRSIGSYADPTSQLKSFFGRTIFNYKEKYLLTLTFRADGSSKFGENNQYGYFPSFAAAWNISKEEFFKVSFVNLLKLRAGWGKTGNQEFPAGSAQARYSFSDGGILRQVNNPNPDLKWQSDRQYNIGLDFSILSNRISGTIDYFNKSTTNLLFPSPPIQPAPPDALIRWINLPGKIENKGVEVLLITAIIDNKNFGIDLGTNLTFLKNNVSGFPAPVYTGFLGSPVQVIENGYPMNTFFVREFLGIDKVTGFSNYTDGGATFYHLGNPNPKVLMGISPSFRYKKLSLTANMYGVFGHDLFFTPLFAVLNVGNINVGSNIGLSVFKNPVKESLANPSQSPSSRYIFKGNYLKMANLTFNYALGNVKNIFKEVNIYFTGQNLFIITKYPGFNPETNYDASINGIPSVGIDAPHYPSSRTIIFGINFSL